MTNETEKVFRLQRKWNVYFFDILFLSLVMDKSQRTLPTGLFEHSTEPLLANLVICKVPQ